MGFEVGDSMAGLLTSLPVAFGALWAASGLGENDVSGSQNDEL